MRDFELESLRKADVKYALPVQITDYVDVAAKARELGCRVPVGIALLPGNFATAAGPSELRYHEATPHVRSAWRNIGLVDSGPCQSQSVKAVATPDPSGHDVPLAVFFGSELRSGPPVQITFALGMAASVLMFNPACASPREIQFNAIVERPSGGYACIAYHGATSELVALARTVRGIWTDTPSPEAAAGSAQAAVQ